MPKLKQTGLDRKDAELIATIKKYQIIRNVTRETLCEALNFTAATYYNRLKRPDKFTIGELRRLKRLLSIPDNELMIL